jgi:hypothetical protein
MQIVTGYGTMWARNQANIDNIPEGKGGLGVYVLFDGSMPMYVGKGKIKNRILKAVKSKRRGQLWDHFSWYAIKNPKMIHDLEVLMLRILPPNLRSLTLQDGNFKNADRSPQGKNKQADPITRKAPLNP